jgi:hypothetical protein
MKKLLSVLMLTLALNFIALIGIAGYLFKTGALNKVKIAGIKAVMYPATTQAVIVDTNTAPDPSTQPTLRLEKLLASVAGRPAGEQVEFMQRTFDAQAAMLDRRQRDLSDLLARIQSEQAKLESDRAAVLAQQKKTDDRDKALNQQVEDKGFEETLDLYNSMPTKQVKDVFLTLDDATVTKYLQAMDASRAAKVLKEFKTPPETERVQKWMEQIRRSSTAEQDKTSAANVGLSKP